MSGEEFFGVPFRLGAQMAGEQAKTLYSKLTRPSPHGMPLQWKIGELKFEDLLAVWERMELDFGSDGKPLWPTIVLQPAAHAEVVEKMKHWHEDPAFRKKWEELIERKRKEFDAREACRRLVD